MVPMEPGRLPPDGPRGRAPVRREHHRRGRHPRLHLGRQLRAGRGDRRRARPARRPRGGPDVPIHVDGASGGFIAPFLQPDLVWDFRLPRVASINTSGHKYGLVYPGVGWVVWRGRRRAARGPGLQGQLPGRGDAHVRAELLPARGARWWRSTTTSCGWASRATGGSSRPARTWRCTCPGEIAKMGPFELLTDGDELPVFAFRIRDESAGFTVFDLSERLRDRGWLVPGLHLPGQPGGHRGAPGGGAQRVQPGPRRPVAQRPAAALSGPGRAPAQPRAAGSGGKRQSFAH